MGPLAGIVTVIAAFAILAVLSWNWGADSRVGRDWEWRDDETAATSSRLLASARRRLAEQAELHERISLRNRPWEEAFLHWSGDPDNPRLHGRIAPPRDGHRRSVTRSGWCPGLIREPSDGEQHCSSH
jgi:hypothetical protein